MDIRARARVTCMTAAACAAAVITAPSALADDPTPAPPPPDVVNQAAATDAPPAAPAEVPHLSSPQNLPPGTTDIPVNEGPRTSYLRGIWHAIQDQDLTWKDGLLMLAQRPMDAGSAPPPGVAAGPQQPGPLEPPPPTP
jgi:hypothetical protein